MAGRGDRAPGSVAFHSTSDKSPRLEWEPFQESEWPAAGAPICPMTRLGPAAAAVEEPSDLAQRFDLRAPGLAFDGCGLGHGTSMQMPDEVRQMPVVREVCWLNARERAGHRRRS